nr:unnamed protein product [Callosobruchus chinensis]
MCRNRCVEKVSEETRQHIFTNFWAMRSYNRRAQFIAGQTEVMDKECTCTRIRNKDLNKQRYRQSTVLYHLPINVISLLKLFSTKNVQLFQELFLWIREAITVIRKRQVTSQSRMLVDICFPYQCTKAITLEEILAKKYLPSHYTLASLYAAYKIAYPQKPVNRKLMRSFSMNSILLLRSRRKILAQHVTN